MAPQPCCCVAKVCRALTDRPVSQIADLKNIYSVTWKSSVDQDSLGRLPVEFIGRCGLSSQFNALTLNCLSKVGTLLRPFRLFSLFPLQHSSRPLMATTCLLAVHFSTLLYYFGSTLQLSIAPVKFHGGKTLAYPGHAGCPRRARSTQPQTNVAPFDCPGPADPE